jgi:hypothetical protein
MEYFILILLIALIVIYYSNRYNVDRFTLSPSVKSIYAPIYASDDMAGIDEDAVKPLTVNDYANNLAYSPTDPNSARYLVNGRVPWSPASYTELINGDGQTAGRVVINK